MAIYYLKWFEMYKMKTEVSDNNVWNRSCPMAEKNNYTK